ICLSTSSQAERQNPQSLRQGKLNAWSECRPQGQVSLVTAAVGSGLDGFDSINDFQIGSRGGFENVGADPCAAVGAAVVFDGEHGFALRVLADGHAANFERAHVRMNSGGMVDSFDEGVDGAIRDLIFSDDAAVG